MGEAMRSSLGVVLFLSTFFCGDVLAQHRMGPYAPPAGQSGTTAMYKDSSDFIAWADSCWVRRGPKDTTDPSKGYASAGTPSNAVGKADNSSVVSLGDGGKATLRFDSPIRNGPGPDFAVFENSFSDDFLELAFVEVSSDGSNFVRFPAHSLTDTSSQVGSFGSTDATDLNNLAGKYRGGYGTPFDLEELSDSAGIDIDEITHVRVLDVVGCIQNGFATYDKEGRKVNDPWPTEFESGGFDLDGVGVVHSQSSSLDRRPSSPDPEAFYDPADRSIRVHKPLDVRKLELFDLQGRRRAIWEGKGRQRFPVDKDLHGIFILKVKSENGSGTRKLIIR